MKNLTHENLRYTVIRESVLLFKKVLCVVMNLHFSCITVLKVVVSVFYQAGSNRGL